MSDSNGSGTKRDETHGAPWEGNLRHRTDPNRVQGGVPDQVTLPGTQDHGRRPDYIPPDASVSDAARPPPTGRALAVDPQPHRTKEPSYYDVPMLKPPVWEALISIYFFLGGLSGGAFILSRLAERFGGSKFRDASRLGSYVALAALLPCPPLLVYDLGDPKRFHHMLRVWKPKSPMNFGSWVLTGYGGPAAIEAVRQFIARRGDRLPPEERSRLMRIARDGKLIAVNDAAGVPLALLVATYTGLLLSTTSNPLWCKNRWLAPLFVASAVSTGAEAISLAVDVTTRGRRSESPQRALRWIDTVAHAAEGVAMHGFMREAGEKARPLTHGSQKTAHHLSTGAIVAAEALKLVPVPRAMQKPKRMLTATLGLFGGLCVRWSITQGGHESGADPRAARVNSGTKLPPRSVTGAEPPNPEKTNAGGNA